MCQLRGVPAVCKLRTNPGPIRFRMRVLAGGRFPCVPAQRQHGRTGDFFKLEIGWAVGRINRVFDRATMCGRLLPVVETWNAQHPVTVRASRIAAEGMSDQLEGLFLMFEIETSDPPERLVFAGRC